MQCTWYTEPENETAVRQDEERMLLYTRKQQGQNTSENIIHAVRPCSAPVLCTAILFERCLPLQDYDSSFCRRPTAGHQARAAESRSTLRQPPWRGLRGE